MRRPSSDPEWWVAAGLLLVPWAAAQSFLTAISQFPQLSNFTTLMYDNPGLAGALLTSNATSLTKMTVLVPDNSAFDKLQAALGVPVGSMTVAELEPILQYHLLVDELSTANFTVPNGTTRPTFLTGSEYNNRSAGAALGSSGIEGDAHNGQVLFIQSANEASSPARRFTVRRQLQNPTKVVAQGGLGHQVNMTAVDGYWDGGLFQIVDAFLTLPLNCTESIRRWQMNAVYASLQKTGLGVPLDYSQNVTCLTPNDAAFVAAGSPNITASIFELQEIMLLHVLTEPLYTNFLQDGQEYTSYSNQTVRVSIRDGEIFFNDAQLIHTNVMTNNGLMHVLDRVMSPLEANQTATSSGTSRPTSTRSATSSSAATTTTQESSATASAQTTSSSKAAAVPWAVPASEASWLTSAVLLVLGFWV